MRATKPSERHACRQRQPPATVTVSCARWFRLYGFFAETLLKHSEVKVNILVREVILVMHRLYPEWCHSFCERLVRGFRGYRGSKFQFLWLFAFKCSLAAVCAINLRLIFAVDGWFLVKLCKVLNSVVTIKGFVLGLKRMFVYKRVTGIAFIQIISG